MTTTSTGTAGAGACAPGNDEAPAGSTPPRPESYRNLLIALYCAAPLAAPAALALLLLALAATGGVR